MRIGLFACALFTLPLHAAAQTGEMWELKSQMNIPGMPAGMGAQTSRVCQGDDPERAKAAEKDKENCKVTEKKNTATRTQITMVCKSGTLSVDQTYNAARTEFKGTTKMTSKDGDITINTTGRKVGACDLAEQKREQDAQAAATKKQVAAGVAAGAAAAKATSDIYIKGCNEALEKMEYYGFGGQGQCHSNPKAKDCVEMAKSYPDAAKTCSARAGDFCKRFQTANGFIKAKGAEGAAKMCGVSTKAIKAAQCPRAEKDGSLAFLGYYCPVEAKPLAEVQCVGRDYTSKLGGKYNAFCTNYLANADFESGAKERPTANEPPSERQAAQPATQPGSQPGSQPPSATDQVKQGVSKGIDKLKGLFGR
jgi:hypothetical protein